jgi:putative CocE/NonD family hydrolase
MLRTSPLLLAALLGTTAAAQLPSEMPTRFQPSTAGFDFERREAEVPMRDGVKLHTVVLVPRGAHGLPILMKRTPYDADASTLARHGSHLETVLSDLGDVVGDGSYIVVHQDIRGKYGSQGDYVMNRPLRGPLNATRVDHATDTYDTIDWLVKHVPESNGRVGLFGISYGGFLTLMGTVDPHPALKVAVPMNPMVDGWMGDDWFHHGAFRAINLEYIHDQQATRKNEQTWWTPRHDEYETFLLAGSMGELGKQRGLEQLGFWQKVLAHPAYDAFWQQQAVDRLLAARPLTVPMMLVHGLWDQEDIYGPLAVYRALKSKDARHDKLFLVLGPWYHGQQRGEASALGAIRFDADTGLQFRRDLFKPFVDQYLREGAPQAHLSPVTAFVTGDNTWAHLDTWPSGCVQGCRLEPRPLYLGAGQQAGFTPPAGGGEAFDEWVSDPAKPIPYRTRPLRPTGERYLEVWSPWLVDDQRNYASRTDVVTYTTEPLRTPLQVAGAPVVNLVASTSGTDSDWVVKLIDVYPDEVASDPRLGGYQLMVSADIFRGRYRESFERPAPLAPGKPLPYRWELPAANHVFKPGHRLMVQVQSSWFPLYDRNPQTFVPNIFWAQPGDYQKATQRVYHAPGQASFVELPVVERGESLR